MEFSRTKIIDKAYGEYLKQASYKEAEFCVCECEFPQANLVGKEQIISSSTKKFVVEF